MTAPGHNYEATVHEPTCTERGYTRHECSVCHSFYDDTYVDANGHVYELIENVPNTCEGAGHKTYKCKNSKSAEELTKALSTNFDDEKIIAKLNAKDSATIVAGEYAFDEKGHSLFVDNAIRESGITETAGQTKVYSDKDNIVTAIKVVAPTTKQLSEIRGIVTAAYQDYLEKQWTEGLHKKYNVKIHEEMLDQIVKELSESK